MNKMFQMWFMLILVLSTIISISASSWMSMWIGMEINSISMIPLMINHNNLLSSESTIKYFITQMIASMMIIFMVSSITMKMPTDMSFKFYMMITMLNSSISLKMGMAPFHFWFPEIINGMNWSPTMIMITWQKIAPMMILSYSYKPTWFIMMIILFSMMISSLMSLNLTNLKKILTFSSINHMSWMLMLTNFKNLWMIYMMIYMMMNINLIFFFMKMNMNNINNIMNKMNFSNKMMITMNFLSLSGVPPLIGFLPKWMTINMLINQKMTFLLIIMILFTIIMIYIYTRMMIPLFSIKMTQNKNYKPEKINLFMNTSSNLTLTLLIKMFN